MISKLIKNKKIVEGYCIREGLRYIQGDIVIIQDADLEYDPSDCQN